jgi:hypothetical protein
VNTAARHRRGEHLVALASLCASILGIAFALHQREASSLVFWMVIGLAALIPMAIGNFQLPRFIRRAPDPDLVATACRQLANSIDALWAERRDWMPRHAGQRGGGNREWVIETKRLYDEGLKSWAIEVFGDAVACGALAASSRPLVESPPSTQLDKLGDLFREAADLLERM